MATRRGKAVGELAGSIVLNLFIESCLGSESQGDDGDNPGEDCSAFQTGVPGLASILGDEIKKRADALKETPPRILRR